MRDHPTFEETYPRYEFSELVRIGIAIGKSILWMLRAARTDWPSALVLDQLNSAGRPTPMRR
jgi:hypothetical protein